MRCATGSICLRGGVIYGIAYELWITNIFEYVTRWSGTARNNAVRYDTIRNGNIEVRLLTIFELIPYKAKKSQCHKAKRSRRHDTTRRGTIRGKTVRWKYKIFPEPGQTVETTRYETIRCDTMRYDTRQNCKVKIQNIPRTLLCVVWG